MIASGSGAGTYRAMTITYCLGNDVNLDQAINLYNACTLGDRRPLDDRKIAQQMMQHANHVITAWDG